MSRTKEEKNKALVLEAFDTLLNKRDYVAAERLRRWAGREPDLAKLIFDKKRGGSSLVG
jgi:hypothetical protein